MTMMNFEYYTPTDVYFGKGTVAKTGALCKAQGATKVLLHYGSERVKRNGLLPGIETQLKELGIGYVELGGVIPNPLVSKVREGIALCRKEGVDFLLAVGGGSVIDSVKAIGYGLADPDRGDVWDYYARKRKPIGCTPLGVVLTIAATGSEMSSSTVITNEDGGLKRGCSSNYVRPRFAIMDPTLTMTLPAYQTACGCTDICMHTLERYFHNGGGMELTDSMAEALLRTVMTNAQILVTEPENYEARAEVMWAGSLSHNGLTGCGTDGGDWSCHKLEHELGGMYDVAHGAGLAAVWGTWARYVFHYNPERFARLATNVLGVTPQGTVEDTALAGIARMEEFFRSIGMPTNLRELGVSPTEEEYRELARKCADAVGGHMGSIKSLDQTDMENIYRAAY